MTPQEVEAVEAIVERKVREILLSIATTPVKADSDLIPLNRAYKSLGYSSAKALYGAIDSGLFRLGKEVFDKRKPGSKLARYLFDLNACRDRLKEDGEQRRGV